MSDSNVCDKCGARRRDESKDFQFFVAKSVIGFITMTACFVLLRMFFPGALAQPMSNPSGIVLLAMGSHTDRLSGVDFTLYTVDASMNEQDAIQSYYSAFVNENPPVRKELVRL
ncbi:uncharacterized protein N7518_006030 [Penicillium psychrosexuale]|uniref:uncharacterized protein n=1 Tax=Penicillium psychrosexuale TaxID=1002107 RepID=UPI0025451946|nr:uncharacterized protein N7518_006030 [Penicillium psychrosexuale]KAJ5789019.1 hypothetical protein N7518_006030 [Penicillium psychrosexuale]